MKPAHCPHCGTPANPLRLSLYSPGTAFRCERCRKQSRFDRRSLASFGGIGALVGAATQATFHFEGLVLVSVAACATLLLIVAMWLSLTLRPLEEKA